MRQNAPWRSPSSIQVLLISVNLARLPSLQVQTSIVSSENDQETEMLVRKGLLSSAGRNSVMAMIAVLVVAMSEPPLAIAGPAVPAPTGVSVTAASSDATDFSAARRRHYHRGGNAAALAIFGMAIGAIAAQQREDYYYNYGYGPGYYGGGPYYYGGPYRYYGRRHYYYGPY
jgi:hypothetical protein